MAGYVATTRRAPVQLTIITVTFHKTLRRKANRSTAMQPRTNPGGAAADQRRPRNINVFETGEDAGRVRGEPLIPGNPRPGLYVWGNNLMRNSRVWRPVTFDRRSRDDVPAFRFAAPSARPGEGGMLADAPPRPPAVERRSGLNSPREERASGLGESEGDNGRRPEAEDAEDASLGSRPMSMSPEDDPQQQQQQQKQ
ncbi:hypothetical protein PCL_05419 [Purpureocillium lilacinum]|uniref:Uncharacterized protein n=1 Tax=Purpureocillium lilacinum TaxID=33203 RepID=A0A2U3DVC3_PURLI|nr:hypothetical protein PCL_05419 [Purpureocillium lilacinum]